MLLYLASFGKMLLHPQMGLREKPPFKESLVVWLRCTDNLNKNGFRPMQYTSFSLALKDGQNKQECLSLILSGASHGEPFS